MLTTKEAFNELYSELNKGDRRFYLGKDRYSHIETSVTRYLLGNDIYILEIHAETDRNNPPSFDANLTCYCYFLYQDGKRVTTPNEVKDLIKEITCIEFPELILDNNEPHLHNRELYGIFTDTDAFYNLIGRDIIPDDDNKLEVAQ